MKDIWQRIENWLQKNAPEIYQDLNPGATEEEIKEAEAYLRLDFPQTLKDSLKIHNGQKGAEGKWLVDGWQLLSLEKMMDNWDFWDDLIGSGNFSEIKSNPGEGIRDDWWNPGWIPVAGSGANDYYCLDCAPSEKGKYGQMLVLWHDMPDRELLAPNYRSWLEKFAQDLENDRYEVAEEYDGLVLKE